MSALKSDPAAATAAVPTALFRATVAMPLDSDRCLLGDGRSAVRAVSCLTVLEAGDVVLVAPGSEGCHVLHVLERGGNRRSALVLAGPDDGELRLRGRKLCLHANEEIEIIAAGNARFSSLGGNVSLDGNNLFINVGDNLVQQSRHFVAKAVQYLVDARHLLKLHGKDALITAERDIKADAERISMG